MFLDISIKSKNLRSINKFVTFLKLYLTRKDLNTIVIKSEFKKVGNRKVITVLKSPHVNKNAQEQFEVSVYRVQITVFSLKYFLLLIFIKYVQSTILFSDIHLKVKVRINNSRYHNQIIDNLNPNNFYLENYDKIYKQYDNVYRKKICVNTMYYLMLFDIYGELNLKRVIQIDK